MMERPEWQKPMLIILGRGTPNEAILKKCKNLGGSAAITQNSACQIGSCRMNCDNINES